MDKVWTIVSDVALMVIFITMLCRAHDLKWKPGLRWQARLVGFVICGTMPIGIAFDGAPSPYQALFHVGLMMVFMTTPQLPPWHRWITGKEEARDTN